MASHRRQPGVANTLYRPGEDRDTQRAANPPAPLVQKVRDVDAAHALAVRQRHDEVDVRQLEQDQRQQSDVEQLLHLFVLPEHVGRIRLL